MVYVTDTTFRDGHQSLFATRMKTEDMLPIAEAMDEVGFYSLEVWGGATFDVALRFLGENPWDRPKMLKKYIKKTPMQMLLRGQNLVGYRHYPDDVVEKFIHKAAEAGIEIFRIFDALNDLRNMRKAIEVARKVGRVEGAIVYTISPVHSIDYFISLAKELESMEVDTICIKDMAGLLSPSVAQELVRRLKKEVSVPIHLHMHDTVGWSLITYMKAIEAGVDIVDTAMSPFAFGTSQPATESLVAALRGTPYDTGIDLGMLEEIAEYLRKVERKLRIYSSPEIRIADSRVLKYQIPGGMLSNLYNQLKEMKAEERLEEVLAEVPRVRAEVGYPPLVTPLSQIVGTQAVLNVLAGERWKNVTKEMKAYLKGHYGRPPAPISEEILRKVLGSEERIEVRPADLLEPEFDRVKAEMEGSDEDVLTHILFPNIKKVKRAPSKNAKKYKLWINGEEYLVAVEELKE